MYYFDADFLGQYLDQGVELKVFVDGEYYTIADRSDLESQSYGIAYDLNGKPHTFDYREITQIKIGDNIMTIDQLQDKIAGDDAEGDEESPEGEEDIDAMGDEMGAEPDMDVPSGGGEEAPEGGGGEEAPAEEPEEPEPPRESIYYEDMVKNMLNEAKKKKKKDVAHNGLSVGDMVQNVDSRCEYYGSRGTVTDITLPDKDGGMTEVEYRIFNYGYNFKPGEKVTQPLSQLQKIGNDG